MSLPLNPYFCKDLHQTTYKWGDTTINICFNICYNGGLLHFVITHPGELPLSKPNQFQLQESLYSYPYHYLPTISDNEEISIHQILPWGLEYLTYMSFIVDLIKSYKPTSLLDVGCGDGRLIHMVKGFVPLVHGVDVSEKAIAFARAFNSEVSFTCGDVSTIETKYDLLALVEVLEHIHESDIDQFLRKLVDLMDPNCTLLISVPTINVPFNPKHYRHYTLEILKDQIGEYFVIKELWGLYKRCATERVLRGMLRNPLFILNNQWIKKQVWAFHKKATYITSPSEGSHLVCIAQLRN
jgi:SAM-dependent methyltransferase